MIDKGINIEAKNSRGETALASVVSDTGIHNVLASQASRKEIVKTLIKNGADVDARDNSNRTPLHQLVDRVSASQYAYNLFASENQRELGLWLETRLSLKEIDEEIVKILIDNGADVDAEDNQGRNLLFDVTHPKIAQILIDNGADVNHIVSVNGRSKMRQTLLYEKIIGKNVEVAQVLIRNGADVNPKDESGRNFLFTIEHPEIAKLVIENGANVNAKNNSGKTPLFFADNSEVAQVLIEKGADVNLRNNDGKTPLSVVEQRLESELKSYDERVGLYLESRNRNKVMAHKYHYTLNSDRDIIDSIVKATEVRQLLINRGGVN